MGMSQHVQGVNVTYGRMRPPLQSHVMTLKRYAQIKRSYRYIPSQQMAHESAHIARLHAAEAFPGPQPLRMRESASAAAESRDAALGTPAASLSLPPYLVAPAPRRMLAIMLRPMLVA